MSDPSRVRVTGPLEPFAAGFAAELSRQGYTEGSAGQQMRLMAHVSRWLAAEGSGPAALTSATVERFCGARRAAGHANHVTAKALGPLLAHLRGLGVAPVALRPPPQGPVEELLSRYRRYLEIERGLAPAVARGYVDKVRPFLEELAGPDGIELGRLGAPEVMAFVVARCPRLGRSSAKLTVTALRSLLGFLHLEGELGRSLSEAVPSVAAPRLAGLPRRLEPDQVRSLLASCERRTATGRRDLAILTVLVRLGLRAGEVAALSLDDVDWRAGEVVVRGKAGRSERLPLPADVGEAIAAYLRDGRPDSAEGRSLFVRAVAPRRALSAGGVTQVVAAAAQRGGLGRIHAHRLRHTAASEMLRAGASLAEIGQVLRHRRAMSTAIYAKVDREVLRQLARPWPGALR